ncbi:MAG: aldo/keto reductase [Acidobacteriota bacterium]
MVSALSMGTVSLGLDYGIRQPGGWRRPSRQQAIRLLKIAADAGITLFDTAPAYGMSEELLGEALGDNRGCHFATKVAVPAGPNPAGCRIDPRDLRKSLESSVESSLRKLRRDFLDIVQIHNATGEVIQRGDMLETLSRLSEQGKIGLIGASVYGEHNALAALCDPRIRVLQVAFNLLDQQMAERVLPRAFQSGVGIMARSALLKGVLSPKGRWLGPQLRPLQLAVERVLKLLETGWKDLPEVAVRYCLGVSSISTVLAGPRTVCELRAALAALRKGPLTLSTQISQVLRVDDPDLVNPSTWQAL